MAKKSKRRKSGKKRNGTLASSPALVGTTAIATEIIGNALGQVLADGLEKYFGKGSGKKKKTQEEVEATDVAAAVVSLLGERGPAPIPDVLKCAPGGLTRILRALRDLQQFHLIEYDAEARRVGLTPAGAEAATALKRSDNYSSAATLPETMPA